MQVGKDRHVELNSDLLFVEHSCLPSVVCIWLVDCYIFSLLGEGMGFDDIKYPDF